MKKVLIALDYGPTARKIAETGYAMAKSMNAEITLIHVTTDAIYYSSRSYSPVLGLDAFNNAGILETTPIEVVKKAAQDYLEQMKQHLGDTAISSVVEEGDTGDGILEAAKALKADVIVMGTHSRRGLSKILLGSVAEKVLRHSTTPLFIIPVKTTENQ
ncbi:MAG: universal stress protein [Chitinophagaceae bacterium]|nr:universal stress protein [Chitinophagaceae bacterium]